VGRDFKAGIETAFDLKRQKSTWIVSENEMIMIWYEMKALKSFELSCSQSNVWRNWIKRWRQWLKYLLLVEELTTCMVQPIDRLVDQEPGILDWKRPWLRSDNSCRNPGNLFWYCQFYTCLIWHHATLEYISVLSRTSVCRLCNGNVTQKTSEKATVQHCVT